MDHDPDVSRNKRSCPGQSNSSLVQLRVSLSPEQQMSSSTKEILLLKCVFTE